MKPSFEPDSGAVVDAFHRLYYEAAERTWKDTRWLGVPLYKCPLDLWIYQELLAALRPDLVIETGTFHGGSALYLASVLELLGGDGRVVSIDVERRPGLPEHERIRYLTGSSTEPAVLDRVEREVDGRGKVLAILDSDHGKEHVLAEMRSYGRWVTPGSYLIVEDTNINGHPVRPGWGPGPMEAVEVFLAESNAFELDRGCEKFLLTQNPRGYLRRRY